MKKTGIFLGVFLMPLALLLLASCGSSDVSHSTSRIGDKSAEDYYRQFIHSAAKKQYLTRSNTRLRDMEATSSLTYTGKLFLYADGNYAYEYVEDKSTPNGGGITLHTRLFEKRVVGKWEVKDTRLSLIGLGTASGITVNAIETVAISFGQPINTAELKGRADVHFPVMEN